MSEAVLYKDFLINLSHLFSNQENVGCLLLRAIRDPHAAGKVYKFQGNTAFFLNLYNQRKKLSCKLGVIVVTDGIGSKEGVYAEVLHSPIL